MTKLTISEIRSPKSLEINEIIEVINLKKHKKLGYFVPISYEDLFKKFLDEVEKIEKLKKIKRVAMAQKQDRIEDINDGIE